LKVELITCVKCGHAKLPKYFGNSESKKNGKQSWCILCSNNNEPSSEHYADKILKSLGKQDDLL